MYGILFIVLFGIMGKTQDTLVTGAYYLSGVMEMASGFKLNPDSTFEFYFSYGALDRFGSGTWKMDNNQVVLNSRPYPGSDFRLKDRTKTRDPFVQVSIEIQNPALLPYFYAYDRLDPDQPPPAADRHGIIRLPLSTDTIHLLFEFVPERVSVFPVDTSQFNQFRFDIEPWITEVFFSDFRLTFRDGKLEGPHPLMVNKVFEYRKE